MVSIITPCSRVYNLPLICKSIIDQGEPIEWVIVYDGNVVSEVDERIVMYVNSKIQLKLLIDYNNDPKTGNAWWLRNIGIDNATGDYLYFLDDDTVLHPNFCKTVKKVSTKLAILNQIGRSGELRFRNGLNFNMLNRLLIDTAQLYVKNGLGVYWGSSSNYYEEMVYLQNILSVIDPNSDITYIQEPLSYHNRLKVY